VALVPVISRSRSNSCAAKKRATLSIASRPPARAAASPKLGVIGHGGPLAELLGQVADLYRGGDPR
jgi:hypothetical protein